MNGNLILSFDDIRIIAYITREKVRVLTSNCPALLADSEDSAKKITIDIAKTMKESRCGLTTGDYMIIKI